MRIRQQSNRVVIDVPGKVNIYLEVLAKRPDGFHEIETLMATAGLCDTLVFESNTSQKLSFDCRWGSGYQAFGEALQRRFPESDLFGPLPKTADNLAWRALELLRQEASENLGAAVHLIKRIPTAAGLGGASADAAAALVAGNLGWKLNYDPERLAGLAAQLGSDVPFFLDQSAAICRGRGEQVEAVSKLQRRPVVIVRPPTGLSTPLVYGKCRPASSAVGGAIQCRDAWNGSDRGVQKGMVNRLEAPAQELSAWVAKVSQQLMRMNLVAHQMSGSGSSFFAVCRTARQARRVAGRLQCLGMGAIAAGCCPAEPYSL